MVAEAKPESLLDVFDNSIDGEAWTRLFKYGPEGQLKRLVERVPDWSVQIHDAVLSAHSHGHSA